MVYGKFIITTLYFKTYPGLKKIKFENVASIKAILDGHIQHGDMVRLCKSD